MKPNTSDGDVIGYTARAGTTAAPRARSPSTCSVTRRSHDELARRGQRGPVPLPTARLGRLHGLDTHTAHTRHGRARSVGGVLGRAVTFALVGLEPRRVEVEAHLPKGLPAFTVVGLADRACQEAKHRVRSGVISALLDWPDNARITVNLAPAALRKEGSGFDLPIALALLAALPASPSRTARPARLPR